MEDPPTTASRAEILSAKKVPAGLCSLAVVRKADRGSVSLYLPHGLAAVAKAADVNPGAAMLASGKAPDSESSEESDTDSPTPSKVIGVAKLFSPGQYVACVVLRAMDTGEGATDKVLHVSLVPSVVNSGLGFEHLTKDLSTVWGAVVSKEDHGFVVDLGIPGVAAFLPFKSVVGGPSSLFPGSCAFFRVAVVKKSASSVSLSYDPSTSPHLMSQPGALSITSVKPGMLVKGSVKKILRNGVAVSFLSFFVGTLDLCHLPLPASAFWASTLEKTQDIVCRVLFVNLATKAIGLSAAPHILALSPVSFSVTHGAVIDPATIVRVDPGVGVTLSFADADATPRSKAEAAETVKTLCQWGSMAFCHVSRLSDGHVEHVERTFHVGNVVQSRVVGFSPMEALVNVSLQPSVLKAAVLSYAELVPGQIISGTVMTVDDFGILVTLGQGIRGLVPPQHCSDAQVTPQKALRAKIGSVVKVRVLDVNLGKRRCSLTLKRTLLETSLPLITSYEEAAAGAPRLISHGVVTSIQPGLGLIVTFYGNVRGLVGEKELKLAGMESAEACEHMMGSVVKARVQSVDLAKKRIELSLRLSKAAAAPAAPAAGDIPALGSVVSCAVELLSTTPSDADQAPFAVVRIVDAAGKTRCQGTLSQVQCGDLVDDARARFAALKPSKRLMDMLVIEHFGPSKNGGYPVALSIKPALLKASADMPTVLQPQLDTVQAGSLFVGYVASVKDFGVFVRFVGGFSALAPKNLLSDDPAGLAAYQPGQTVWAVVKSVDVSAKRLVLSLKPSHVKKLLPEPAKDPVEGPQKKNRRERSGSVSGLSAATLTVGTTVLCRAEASSLSVTDGVGIDPHCPLLKAGLAVQLTGVSGRYKARLTLAECCDVCPYTGSVINNEGFTTFQRLVASSSSAPVFRAKVVSIKAGKSKFGPDGEVLREGVADVELTIRPSDLALAEGELAYVRPSFSGSVVQTTPLKRKPITSVETHVSSVGFVRGAWCWGVVESQSSEGLLIGMGAGVRGRLPVLEADRGSSGSSQDQLAVLNDVAQGRRYTPGLPVLCVVLRSDQPNKILYLSGYRAPLAIAASAKAIADTKASGRDALTAAASVLKAGDAFPVGSVVFGQVESPTDTFSTALSLRVRLAPSVLAHVCATHSADRAQWKNSPFSTRFNGEVVYGVVLPLLPPSARSQPVSSAVDEEEGDGDVESASEEEALDASAPPAAGAGRPTKASKSSKGKSRVSLSLRPSLISLAEKIGPADRCEALVQEEARERSSLRVTGTLVSGFVECANAKGCFILVGRGLMARCLLKELSDGFVKDPAASFPTGKLVAGRVLACEAAGSISLSLKGSVVTGKRSLLAVDAKPQSVVDAVESSSDSEDDDDTEAVPVGVAAKRPAAFAASDDESEGEVSGEESDASDESLPERTAVPSSRALKKSKFDWDGEAEPSSAGSDGGGDEWDIPAETDENEQTTGRRARASAKKRLEGEVDRQEKRLAADDFTPETPQDFERLVLASPGSSLVWIRYMAFQLSVTEIEGARAIAERALKSISLRDEQEKLNVWVAYLNLEHTYGDVSSLAALFSRALQHNDPKRVHSHMLSMYEARNKIEEANALYKIATKKFPGSKQFWCNWGSFLMKTGDAEAARAVMTRPLSILPRRKHAAVIQRFALMEYKAGFQERGRTIFEGLLSSDAKRVDAWSVYIDQEVSAGDFDAVRRLFERIIHVKLSSKKMKFFFKKYLEFEAAHGTSDTVQHVRDAAKAYVESLAG